MDRPARRLDVEAVWPSSRRRGSAGRTRAQRRSACHSVRSNGRGSSTTCETMSKRIVARRSRSYLGQPGSPVVANATQARCMVSASACGGSLAEQRALHLGGAEVQGVEDEGDLEGVAGTERATEGRRAPGELVHVGGRRARRRGHRPGGWPGRRHHQSVSMAASTSPGRGVRVGRSDRQPRRRPTPRRPPPPRTRTRATGPARISSVTRSSEPLATDEQPPVVGVRADHHVDAGAGAPGDPVDRVLGDDVAVDDRLPRAACWPRPHRPSASGRDGRPGRP